MNAPMETPSGSGLIALLNEARASQQRGDFSAARAAAERAVALDPSHPGARLLFIETLIHTGEPARALAELNALEERAARDARLLQQIAQIYTHLNRHAEAERCCRRSAGLDNANTQYQYNLATALIAVGKLDAAEVLLNRVIAAASGDYDAYYNRATLRTQTREKNHVSAMERVLASAKSPDVEVRVGYALAKELEDLGEHDRSFRYLTRAAEARRRNLSYRVEGDVEAIAEIARVFDTNLFTLLNEGHGDPRPIFVLGLPRSGTTLVDRILSSHSLVESGGESSNFPIALVRTAGPGLGKVDLIRRSAGLDFAALGRAYAAMQAPHDSGMPHLIDKTPLNFLYLGLIALALPNARIVHVRRGAMDVCFAMYKTLFRMAYPFSYGLDDLGKYYLAYHGLMQHWRRVLPGRFLDLDYEALVADQEGESRRLIAHCGLDWEDACLAPENNAKASLTASAAQVRRPVYATSVGRWRAHTAGLAPLARLLRAGGIDVERS
jgi:tetratricopeptide (TPR) repeat protein